MTAREKIFKAVEDFKELGMKEFTIQEICEVLGLDYSNKSNDCRNISTTLPKLVNAGDMYKLRKTRPRSGTVKAGRGYSVYTWSLKYYEQEKASWKEEDIDKPKSLDDTNLNYAQIGEAIMTRMLGI